MSASVSEKRVAMLRSDAEEVDVAMRPWVARLLDDDRARDDGDDADRHVDEEDGLPVDVLDEHAAEDRPGDQRDPRDAAVDAERRAEFRPPEGRGDDRRRDRREDRAADALYPAGDLQLGDILRERAAERRCGEDEEADQEKPLAPEEVTDFRHRQDQRGQHQRVRVDHPLEFGEGGLEVLRDARQGDIDDRDIEERHEEGEVDGG